MLHAGASSWGGARPIGLPHTSDSRLASSSAENMLQHYRPLGYGEDKIGNVAILKHSRTYKSCVFASSGAPVYA